MARLGDILTKMGGSSPSQMAHASRAKAQHPDAPIGQLLTQHSGVAPRALARAVAEQRNVPAIWLDKTPPDETLFRTADIPHYLEFDAIPWRVEDGHMVLATTTPCPALTAWAEAHYGMPIISLVTSPRDIAQYVQTRGGEYFTRHARHKLHRQHRHMSALRTLIPSQQLQLSVLLCMLLAAGIYAPQSSLYVALWASNLFYISTIMFKYMLLSRWWLADAVYPAPLPKLNLPTYSILVPMYKEPMQVVQNIIQHLHELEYPQHKKEVFMLCEADDTDTINAIKAAHPPHYMRIIPVPNSQPRTKPKACNYVLPMLNGEFTVIYDAEDKPDPYQLKRAVEHFTARPEIACLQSPLNYYNRRENLLTRLFAIEYSTLFRMQLPALRALGIPMPLGGTSNHIRTEVLQKVGGWDPFNVTEDADLGVRLAYYGHQTDMLDSITLEEAPITLGAWLKQRSRWIKGYMQTWLVYMRDPKALKARIGYDGYVGFQFFVGAPALTFLLAPFFWVACMFGMFGMLPFALSPLLLGLCGFSMALGVLSHWLFARTALRIEAWDGMFIAMCLYPFYWLLHSVASVLALIDLVFRPHHWAKTQHGVTKTLH